jgi:hypothetical protein
MENVGKMQLDDNLRNAIRQQLTARPARAATATAREYRFKPFVSQALGVDASQIEESKSYLRAHGIAAEYTADGGCIVGSEKQFRDIARASGMYDGANGYQVRNFEGRTIRTGREPVKARVEAGKRIRKILEE